MEFPTMAEKAIAEWDHKGSFNVLARRYGAFYEKSHRTIEWVFDDDSIVVVTGRGKSHKLVAKLP